MNHQRSFHHLGNRMTKSQELSRTRRTKTIDFSHTLFGLLNADIGNDNYKKKIIYFHFPILNVMGDDSNTESNSEVIK